jgi:hypothetical protein
MFSSRIGLLNKGPLRRPGKIQTAAPQDDSTMLLVVAQHQTVQAAPKNRHTDDKACVNLGSLDMPHYHEGLASREYISADTRAYDGSVHAKGDMCVAIHYLWGISELQGRIGITGAGPAGGPYPIPA